MGFPVIDGQRTIEFGTPGEMRERLVGLVVQGRKRATAGLLEEYRTEGEPIEHPGEILVVVNSAGEAVGRIQVSRVEVGRFADVSDELALAEGEGDLTGEMFRESHRAFWTSVGETITDDTEIVQVYFDLLPS
jgi:uncharacterized protein YhfF